MRHLISFAEVVRGKNKAVFFLVGGIAASDFRKTDAVFAKETFNNGGVYALSYMQKRHIGNSLDGHSALYLMVLQIKSKMEVTGGALHPID